MVQRYWGDQVNSWEDHHIVIEPHVDHPSMEEGEEALPHVLERLVRPLLPRRGELPFGRLRANGA